MEFELNLEQKMFHRAVLDFGEVKPCAAEVAQTGDSGTRGADFEGRVIMLL
jgi:hypothetical protein